MPVVSAGSRTDKLRASPQGINMDGLILHHPAGRIMQETLLPGENGRYSSPSAYCNIHVCKACEGAGGGERGKKFRCHWDYHGTTHWL